MAQICITHAFMIQDVNTAIAKFDMSAEDFNFLKNFVANAVYDDYDLLLQLADMINDMGKTCTLEYRVQSLCKRRNIPPKDYAWVEVALNDIKSYFDQKCGCDIYSLFGLLK